MFCRQICQIFQIRFTYLTTLYQLYLVVHSKVADLHRHGDEIHGTVQLVLFKLLLEVNVLFTVMQLALHQYDAIGITSSWHYGMEFTCVQQ